MNDPELSYLKQKRQDLHRIPELGFDLPRTSEYIMEELTALGYSPVSVAKSGWIVHIPGNQAEAVALRSDMDALEVKEATGVDFASEFPGRMHACGHDGHMAILLGLARWLSRQPKPEKSIVLIFQPAEEGPGGARIIMESGILQKLGVKSIYGMHLYPGLPQGKLGFREGPFFARNAEFDITVKGKASHAGQPHLGHDALLAGARIIEGVQSLISRSQNPLKPLVLNIGTMEAGSARNIVADRAILKGTLRCYDAMTYQMAVTGLQCVLSGVEVMTQTHAELEVRPFYPEVSNDRDLVRRLRNDLREEDYLELDPLMLAEDFSFYQEKIPGVFLLLGTGREDVGYTSSLHSPRFNFVEDVLKTGVDTYRTILGTEGVWTSPSKAD